MPRTCLLLFAWLLAAHAGAAAVPAAGADPGEEALGPFANWLDLRRDFGAVGDGVADDSEALQRALESLGKDAAAPALHIAAGSYRITRGLTMTSHLEVAVLGEDPATTRIVWDGPAGGEMLLCNGVRYSRFGRLTWDGRGRAESAVVHRWDGKTPGASTANEHVDEVFMDVAYGIRAGKPHLMDAETPVIRCHFLRCTKAGVSIESFNALDWFVWDSRFEDCALGVTNEFGAGNFHVYRSRFLRSTVADISMRNCSYFSVRGNVSQGSQAFLVAHPIGANSSQLTIQGNIVATAGAATPIRLGSLGPTLLIDNAIFSAVPGRPAVEAGGGDLLSLGNAFNATGKPLAGSGRIASIDDRTGVTALPALPAPLPAAAPRHRGPVADLPRGCGAGAIQAAIDASAKLAGKRPVVHLPAGDYAIDRTLVIPGGCDVQLVGDGRRTRLRWRGAAGGTLIACAAPAVATLCDLSLESPGTGLAVAIADREGDRVFMEQAAVGGGKVGLLAERLDATRVDLHDFYHAGNKEAGVRVIGVKGGKGAGLVAIHGGASSDNALSYDASDDGRLLVRDIWYEGGPPGFLRLTGSCRFTLHGARIASGRPGPNQAPSDPGAAGVAIEGPGARVALVACSIGTRVATGPGAKGSSLLLLGCQSDYARWLADDGGGPTAIATALSRTREKAQALIPDQADAARIRDGLAQTRASQPRVLEAPRRDRCDLRLRRVSVRGGEVGIHLRAQ